MGEIMKIYNAGFSNLKYKSKYICRSEITRANMCKMGIPDFIPLDTIKQAFDEIDGDLYLTGNLNIAGRNRHTKYVLKYELYQKVIKY